MSALDVVDETFVAATPTEVAMLLGVEASWRRWWPDLRLAVVENRGPAGIRWQVDGALSATMEMWLEPVLDGTVLHFFLRADRRHPDGSGPRRRDAHRAARRRRVEAKRVAFELKAVLEHRRAPGVAPVPVLG